MIRIPHLPSSYNRRKFDFFSTNGRVFLFSSPQKFQSIQPACDKWGYQTPRGDGLDDLSSGMGAAYLRKVAKPKPRLQAHV